MANTTITPNMGLIVPTVGVDPGPDWANNLNASSFIIDGHDHSSMQGVPIPVTGLNINADLSMNSQNLINARSLRMLIQAGPLSGGLDKGCLFVSGVDLWFNDESGNQIQITTDGGVAGSPGSIANLTSPASASYVAIDQTFIWQSGSSIPANLDCASVILRNLSAGSYGITLEPPSLSSNYTITLPTLPPGQQIVTCDSSGNLAAPYTVDASTIVINSNVIEVATGGITNTQLAAATANALNPPGAIIAYGGTSAPSGWLMCDGTSYAILTYPTLYAAIGDAYGSSSSNFNVPDLRGYFIRGTDNGAGNDPDASSRTGSPGGNTGDNVGSLQASEFGSHSHGGDTGGATDGGNFAIQGSIGAQNNGQNEIQLSYAGNHVHGIGADGGNETRPINVYVNYIIKT